MRNVTTRKEWHVVLLYHVFFAPFHLSRSYTAVRLNSLCATLLVRDVSALRSATARRGERESSAVAERSRTERVPCEPGSARSWSSRSLT